MFKKVIILVLFFFFYSGTGYAFKPETFVSFVHLIDSTEPVSLQKIKLTYQTSTHSATVNDWLLTSKVLNDATGSAYLKTLLSQDNFQTLGLFLIPESKPLDKMTIDERIVEVDHQFDKFFSVFGFYPKVVSAQVMDTQSLNYLQKKFGLQSFVFLPGQHPQVPSGAGGYENSPYIASNKNFFLPSSSRKNRNSVAVVEAQYLNQDNFKQKIDFASQKKFNEFTQITFWTDPSEETDDYINGLKKVYLDLKSLSDKYSLNQKSLAVFSDWFLNRYPESTPAFYFTSGGDHTYQSPWYKIKFAQKDNTLKFENMTVYDQNYYDPSFVVPNPGEPGVQTLPQSNLSHLPNIALEDNLYFSHLKNFDFWKMSLKNVSQEIALEPDKLEFVNIDPSIQSDSLLTATKKDNQTSITFNFLNRQKNISNVILVLFFAGILFYYVLKKKISSHLVLGFSLVIIANLVNFRSGSLFPFGLGFWGPHGHDAIFHLSLIEKFASQPLNLAHPQVSGQAITNYHLFFDYFSGLVVKFTSITPTDLYFRIFPVVAGFLIVFLLDKIMSNLSLSKFQKVLAYILVFFGSSFGYLVRLVQNHDYLTGESAFWANQSLSMFLNPPFLLSVVFLLAFLIIYQKNQKKTIDYLVLIIFGGLLAQIKVYAFILLCLALFFNQSYILSLAVGIFGLMLNLPFAKLSTLPFYFNPLWFSRAMFESADRVYFESIATAWQVFEFSGQYTKIIIISLAALIVFLIGNLGVRVFGFYHLLQSKSQNKLDSLIRYIVVISIMLPLLITQSINPWNSIQFMYYGLFFLGVYTAVTISKNYLFCVIIIFVGTFGSFGTLRDYLTTTSSSRVSHQELLGLNILRNQPKGLVLSPAYKQRSVLFAPVPMYDYTSTAYISALTGQPEYLADTINLDITGINYQDKLKNVQRFYNTTDLVWAKEFLREENISYIIETPLQVLKLEPSQLNLESLHGGGEIKIYKVSTR